MSAKKTTLLMLLAVMALWCAVTQTLALAAGSGHKQDGQVSASSRHDGWWQEQADEDEDEDDDGDTSPTDEDDE